MEQEHTRDFAAKRHGLLMVCWFSREWRNGVKKMVADPISQLTAKILPSLRTTERMM